MELFRVGGDVPDTNYLFMGMRLPLFEIAIQTITNCVSAQAISLTAASTPSNHFSSSYASKFAILTA